MTPAEKDLIRGHLQEIQAILAQPDSDPDERLFGRMDVEYLDSAIEDAYESTMTWLDDDEPRPDVEIYEFTVEGLTKLMPRADRIIEHVLEIHLADAEIHEECWERFHDLRDDPILVGLIDSAMRYWAMTTRFRQAADVVATHHITHVDGVPTLNGERLFPEST